MPRIKMEPSNSMVRSKVVRPLRAVPFLLTMALNVGSKEMKGSVVGKKMKMTRFTAGAVEG